MKTLCVSLICLLAISCHKHSETDETMTASSVSIIDETNPETGAVKTSAEAGETEEITRNVTPHATSDHLEKYAQLKRRILNEKARFKNRTDISDSVKVDLARKYINTTMIDSIFPYWLGTAWDFNGYTEKPRDGVVACGYFVSTTLRDVGIKLNRFKTAQKAASDIILQLCDGTSISRHSSFASLSRHMEEMENLDLLVVGLDFHVGFIYKKDGQSYFAHSNYIDAAGVMVEKLEESDALKSSQTYMIGSVSRNASMLKAWLQ